MASLNRDQIMGMLGFISMFFGGRKKVAAAVDIAVNTFNSIDNVKDIRVKIKDARNQGQALTLNVAEVAMLDTMFNYTDNAAQLIHDKLNK